MYTEESMIRHHLLHGVYPPVAPAYEVVAFDAVRCVNEGDGHTLLRVPGEGRVKATTVVDAFELHRFVRPGGAQ